MTKFYQLDDQKVTGLEIPNFPILVCTDTLTKNDQMYVPTQTKLTAITWIITLDIVSEI